MKNLDANYYIQHVNCQGIQRTNATISIDQDRKTPVVTTGNDFLRAGRPVDLPIVRYELISVWVDTG
jgi:hypothetical protein